MPWAGCGWVSISLVELLLGSLTPAWPVSVNLVESNKNSTSCLHLCVWVSTDFSTRNWFSWICIEGFILDLVDYPEKSWSAKKIFANSLGYSWKSRETCWCFQVQNQLLSPATPTELQGEWRWLLYTVKVLLCLGTHFGISHRNHCSSSP